jgi:hypothetical protein
MHAPWGVFRYWSHRQFAEAHKYKIGIKRSSVKPSPQARNYAIEQSALKARFNADRIFHTDTSVEDFSRTGILVSRFQRSPFCLRPPRAALRVEADPSLALGYPDFAPSALYSVTGYVGLVTEQRENRARHSFQQFLAIF